MNVRVVNLGIPSCDGEAVGVDVYSADVGVLGKCDCIAANAATEVGYVIECVVAFCAVCRDGLARGLLQAFAIKDHFGCAGEFVLGVFAKSEEVDGCAGLLGGICFAKAGDCCKVVTWQFRSFTKELEALGCLEILYFFEGHEGGGFSHTACLKCVEVVKSNSWIWFGHE